MIKAFALGIFAVALSFFAFNTAYGQTATSTPTPTTTTVSPTNTVTTTPAVTVPGGAPATGRG